MSMKSILAPIDGTATSNGVLQAAFVLAGAFKAHINVLHVQPDPKAAVPLLGEGMSGAMIEDMISMAEKEGNEQRQKARALYQDMLAKHDVSESDVPVEGVDLSASWVDDQGREDEVIAHHGRLGDLILVSKPQQENEVYTTLALNAALFETGRPMLLLPASSMTAFPEIVTICWNGSMEGARAVAAALPFIKMAKTVHVITADTSSTDGPVGENLAKYLRWHGVETQSVFFSPAGKSVGLALLSESKKLGAELMIMGGYTHSRMRELILGGATRDVIENADIPVVMGH